MSNSNSHNGTAAPAPWLQVTITIAEAGGDLVMQYRGANSDAVLNALQQALRHVEAQWRYEKAAQLQTQALRAAEDAKLAQRVLNRSH